MSALNTVLARLLSVLQGVRPSYAKSLNPGLALEQIDRLIHHVPITLPEDVYRLYQWRNGTLVDGGDFLPGYRFVSLEAAIACYQSNLDRAANDSCKDGTWQREWFPLFFLDNYFLFVMCDKESSSRLQIWAFDWESYDISPCFESLTSMMSGISECYETGAYFVENDNDKVISLKPTEVAIISRKHNLKQLNECIARLKPDIELDELHELATTLFQLKDPRFTKPLIRILQSTLSQPTSEFDGMSALVIRLLGEIGDRRAESILLESLRNSNWLTRFWATLALGQLKQPRTVSTLIDVAQNDPQTRVRRTAIKALGEIRDRSAIASLQRLSQDSNLYIQAAAQEAYSKINPPKPI